MNSLFFCAWTAVGASPGPLYRHGEEGRLVVCVVFVAVAAVAALVQHLRRRNARARSAVSPEAVTDYVSVFDQLAQDVPSSVDAGDDAAEEEESEPELEPVEEPFGVPLAGEIAVFEAAMIGERLERAGVRFAFRRVTDLPALGEGISSPTNIGRGGLDSRLDLYVHPDDCDRARPIVDAVLKIAP